jgi:hypothetical protein|tara:strand:+ start:79 stop:714 length:636 start_codon:yes stop_codon:yes gene_type:complete
VYSTNSPAKVELPSTGKLVKSTILASLVAVAILVTAVLPAEYGIDPTGIGHVLGLKRMGEIKMSLAKEAAADRKVTATSKQSVPSIEEKVVQPVSEPIVPEVALLNHEMKVTLVPDQGTEIKVTMTKGSKVQYTWWTDGGRANFDVHGDSKKLDINYHSYSKGSEQKSSGVLEAAFDGNHGWFWRNRTSETITVTLQTNGEYSDIELMDEG